ncbi:hypothetical protein SAMN04487931_103299 [Desulfobacula phenolica]|uniref:Uncharacterized protein n=1 Tax=Desulfobacula phenolica TaxID=90732 RepID=A0A1H2ER70_9BACT|nr:hypothetical protein SAMN04487931_103299 [Desulfobacula phenolica]
MEIKSMNQIVINDTPMKDSVDTPDCFGEFNKKNKLCSKYCSISIKCCVLHSKSPKIDVLEKILIQNHYAIKPH